MAFHTALARLALLGLAAGTSLAHGVEWSANEWQLLYGSHFQEPGNDRAVSKSIVTFQHASGYALGRHFLFVDTLNSNRQERNLAGQPEAPSELYGEAYTTLSFSKLTGQTLGFGPIRDIGLTAGINAGSKGSQLHPQPRVYLAGLTVDFAVAEGFFNVDVLAYHDRSCYKGIALCPDYRTTYQITPAWRLPFTWGTVSGEFTGFADFIGSRGAGTVRQVLSQPQVRFDVGKAFAQPGRFYVGLEYQYWQNKFGLEGVNEHHPQLLMLIKF